ncbi:NAD-dependent epimerase/dehydratase family protein [Roseivirga sp.]|uniref:NAD-dependent epimerase/dehydratase family protein n=1 Tax=Roseivirga sp. TaxID=1964215 RepID=UPI003B516547
MKIGIIGGTGMLGHHIAIEAQIRQYELVLIHRKGTDLDKVLDLRYESRIADLNDRGSLIKAFEGLDAVANCAAYYPTVPRPLAQEMKTARLQMKFFLDAIEQAKIEKALYVGGAIALPKVTNGIANEEAIYDKAPENLAPYVQVKWLMDQMAREAANDGLPLVIGIPSMTFGEYDYGPTTGKLIVELANQNLKAYIKGERNVVSARDAGRGLLYALEKGQAGERYLITGENTNMDELVATICERAEVPLLKKTVPLNMAKLVNKLQETRYALFRGDAPKISSTAIAVMAGGQHLDGNKAKVELDYTPNLTMRDAVDRAFIWFEKNGYIKQ